MSTPFQNRIVGTVIVAAVAIIFLPDILDGEKQTYQADFENIPQSPKFESSREIKSFPSEKLETLPKELPLQNEIALDDERSNTHAESSDSQSTLAQEKTDDIKTSPIKKEEDFKEINDSSTETSSDKIVKTKVQKKSSPEKSVANQAWVIQLGSFKHKRNVEDLLTKLRNNGYTAFTKPIKTKNGTLTKVFVGPELLKATLEKKISALKTLTNVEGKMARFTPTNK